MNTQLVFQTLETEPNELLEKVVFEEEKDPQNQSQDSDEQSIPCYKCQQHETSLIQARTEIQQLKEQAQTTLVQAKTEIQQLKDQADAEQRKMAESL